MSVFRTKQIPLDFSPLLVPKLKWCPVNLDGITERDGRFLVFEVKHGEQVSIGQIRMLQAMAKTPKFIVIVVNCKWSAPDEQGARLFAPESFQVMTPDGTLGELILSDTQDFKLRYEKWCRTPSVGIKAFL